MPKLIATRPPTNDLTGQTFGRLTVLTWVPAYRGAYWLCDCICGNRTIAIASKITTGHTKSCGCLRYENSPGFKHGDVGSKLYAIWTAMKKRCYQTASINYHNYGGRGIVMCDEWRDDYRAFRKWAMENGYREGVSIDRIDNDDIYRPGNCRWLGRTEQNRNRRVTKRIMVDGRLISVAEAAEKAGLPYKRVWMRLRAGYTIEDALLDGDDPLGRRVVGGRIGGAATKHPKQPTAPLA